MVRKTLIVLPFLALFGLGVLLLAAWDMHKASAAPEPEIWLQTANAPYPVLFFGFTQCADDPDSFYVLGSYPGQTYFYRYDASNDVWVVLPAFPIPIERSALVCYRDKIFVAGGNSGSAAIDTLYIYDIAEAYWSQGPNMPHVLKQAAVGVWDGKIYVAGGTMTSAPWTPIDHVDVFDINTGIWTDQVGMPMPDPASSPGYAQVGQYLYVVGGWFGDFNNNVNITQRYDMAADTWESGPTFTSARAAFDLVATGTHLYAIGGDADGGSQGDPTALVEALDLSAWPGGSWVDIADPLPMPIEGSAGFCNESVSGGAIWSVGGGSPTYLDDVYYRPTGEECADFHFGDLTRESERLGNHPGGVATFVLPVYNAGTETDTFEITASGTWTITLSESSFNLNPGDTWILGVQIEIPPGANLGDFDTSVVTVTSLVEPAMQDVAVLTTLADSWQEAQSMDEPVGFHSVASCADDPDGFYIIGGSRDNFIEVDDIWHYDSVTDTWTFVTDLPYVMRGWGQSTACYQHKLYVAKNYNFRSYDLDTATWTTLGSPPRSLWAAPMGAWGGRLFVAGGGFGESDEVDIYDIASNTWSVAGEPVPVALGALSTAQVGPYLYLVGGVSPDLWYFNHNTTLRLNMATESWEAGPEFTSRRLLGSLGVTTNHLYAIGGDQNGFDRLEPTGMVEVLDLSQWPDGAWEEIPEPIPWMVEANFGGTCTEGRAGGEVWSVGGAAGRWDHYNVIDQVYYLPVGEPCVNYGVQLLAPEDSWGMIGETVEYLLAITNTGTITDYYQITFASDWPVTPIPGGLGPVGPGESITVTIEVAIPADSQPGDQGVTEITAVSLSDPSTTATAQIITTAYGYGVAVYPESDEKLGAPGDVLEYTLLVTNTGNLGDEFSIVLSGTTWATTVPTTTGWLEPGVAVEIPVTVQIPTDAPPDVVDSAVLTFTSAGDPEVSAVATLTSQTYGYGVILTPEFEEDYGQRGESYTYTLQLINTGDITDTILLSVIGADWAYTLPVTQVTLAAGEGVDVFLVVTVPLDALPGDSDTLILTATSQGDPSQYASSTLVTGMPLWMTYLTLLSK